MDDKQVTPQPPAQAPAAKAKRAYAAPKLVEYGAVRDLTRSAGLAGADDGGTWVFGALKSA